MKKEYKYVIIEGDTFAAMIHASNNVGVKQRKLQKSQVSLKNLKHIALFHHCFVSLKRIDRYWLRQCPLCF